MKVDGQPYRSIWLDEDGRTVVVIDQTRLPHSFATQRLETSRRRRTPSGSWWCAAHR